MYEDLLRHVLDNSARLVYVTNRALGRTLRLLQAGYPGVYSEVCLNEKIAYELALAGSYASKRAACIFPSGGLYEALDPVMSSAYTGVIGGFVVVCVRETDEEAAPLGLFAKLPVILSTSDEDFAESLSYGYTVSERYETPVILETTAGTQGLSTNRAEPGDTPTETKDTRGSPATVSSRFVRNPSRWAATPKFRYELHRKLNEKVEKIREDFERYPGNRIDERTRTGVIAGVMENIEFYEEDSSVLSIATVYPLPTQLVDRFIDSMDRVFLVEGTHPLIRLQLRSAEKVIAEPAHIPPERKKPDEVIYGLLVVRDWLGPGSSLNMAHGMVTTDPSRKVLAITFEDFFFHSGMAGLVNTLYNGSSFLLLILTNSREDQIVSVLEGARFHNYHRIEHTSEIERFKDVDEFTVLFYRGIL
jgi:TPP-dependent indolepyruvate ferredoxin oxidoreductase alpha subunit